MKKENGRRK